MACDLNFILESEGFLKVTGGHDISYTVLYKDVVITARPLPESDIRPN